MGQLIMKSSYSVIKKEKRFLCSRLIELTNDLQQNTTNDEILYCTEHFKLGNELQGQMRDSVIEIIK